MATPSSILAWRIPGTEEPGRLHSLVAKRHDWSDLVRSHAYTETIQRPWKRVLF